jgi:hypothetical protein
MRNKELSKEVNEDMDKIKEDQPIHGCHIFSPLNQLDNLNS